MNCLSLLYAHGGLNAAAASGRMPASAYLSAWAFLAHYIAFLFYFLSTEIFILILYPANVIGLLTFYTFPIMAVGLEQIMHGNLWTH